MTHFKEVQSHTRPWDHAHSHGEQLETAPRTCTVIRITFHGRGMDRKDFFLKAEKRTAMENLTMAMDKTTRADFQKEIDNHTHGGYYPWPCEILL